ncbi:MAG: four helix bundle protein [Gemmatimonadaceae bacterium]|nr:four helix bundle protein [Gemmatimonadaceae bacterium]
MPHNPSRLQVIDRAFALAVAIHRLADRHAEALASCSPSLRSQLLRAVDSVASNLTEATAFDAPKRCRAFLRIAIGSCNEVELQLRLAVALQALPESASTSIAETVTVRRMTYGWMKHLEERAARGLPCE